MTHAEVLMWTQLKGKAIDGVKFRRQHSVGDYIIDFYNTELKLAIEIDGITHQFEKSKKHDKTREDYLSTFGINILRFENERIYRDLYNVIEEIRFEIKHLKKLTTPKSPP